MNNERSNARRLSPVLKMLLALEPSPEELEAAPLSEINAELRSAGIDPQSSIAAVKRLVGGFSAASDAVPLNDSEISIDPANDEMRACVSGVEELLIAVGSECHSVATKAATEIVSLWHLNKDSFVRFLRKPLSAPLDRTAKLEVIDQTGQPGRFPVVTAYREFRVRISVEDAIACLRSPQTQMCNLVDGPGRRIFLARIVPKTDGFSAAWLRLTHRDDILLVSSQLSEQDFSSATAHELNHVMKTLFTKQPRKETTKMEEDKNISFAQAQKAVDHDDKVLSAQWVADDLPLKNGAGIFLDAGSCCLTFWQEIIGQLCANRYSNITVYTNNFMVLQEWAEKVATPQLQGTIVEMAGNLFDAPHLAFYGEGVRRMLMSGVFRASAVYIGTSGIEFDQETGEILFGYHAGDAEHDVKEVLFQCPARKRIILATPQKIGFAGGRVFDVLSVNKLDNRAPIYLVTTEPEPGSECEQQFNEAKKSFLGDKIQTAIYKQGLEFHWIIVDRKSGETPKAKERLDAPRKGDAVT